MAFASSGSAASLSSKVGVIGVTEVRVLVERHLAVERLELVPGQAGQRVDLDQSGVLLDEDLPQVEHQLHRLVGQRLGETGVRDDLAGLGLVDTGAGGDRDLLHRVGIGLRDLLDLDTTLDAGDAEVATVGAVEQEGEVVLLLDAGRGGDEHPVHGQALDLHAEDVRRVLERLIGGLGELDSARLSAPTGLDLCLDHDDAELLGGTLRLFRRVRDDAQRHRYVMLGEELLRLVFHEVHVYPVLFRVVEVRDSTRHPRPDTGVPTRLGRRTGCQQQGRGAAVTAPRVPALAPTADHLEAADLREARLVLERSSTWHVRPERRSRSVRRPSR